MEFGELRSWIAAKAGQRVYWKTFYEVIEPFLQDRIFFEEAVLPYLYAEISRSRIQIDSLSYSIKDLAEKHSLFQGAVFGLFLSEYKEEKDLDWMHAPPFQELVLRKDFDLSHMQHKETLERLRVLTLPNEDPDYLRPFTLLREIHVCPDEESREFLRWGYFPNTLESLTLQRIQVRPRILKKLPSGMKSLLLPKEFKSLQETAKFRKRSPRTTLIFG